MPTGTVTGNSIVTMTDNTMIIVSDDDKHTADVMALTYYTGILYSGGDDGKIKMWTEDLKLIKDFQAHPVNIYSLAIAPPTGSNTDATLYSSSNDGTIKAWSAAKGEFKKDLISYDNEVEVLYVHKGILYAGDDKGSVGVFEDDKLKLIFALLEEIKDLIVHDNLMYTVRDLDVVITEFLSADSSRYMTRQTLVGKSPLCLAGDKLCFTSRCGRKIVCHHNNKEDKFKFLSETEAHEMIINALCSYEKADGSILLLSGGWDKVIKVWHVEKDGKLTLKKSIVIRSYINKILIVDDTKAFVSGTEGFICRIDL